MAQPKQQQRRVSRPEAVGHAREWVPRPLMREDRPPRIRTHEKKRAGVDHPEQIPSQGGYPDDRGSGIRRLRWNRGHAPLLTASPARRPPALPSPPPSSARASAPSHPDRRPPSPARTRMESPPPFLRRRRAR